MKIKRNRFNIGFLSVGDILRERDINNAFTKEEFLYLINSENENLKKGFYGPKGIEGEICYIVLGRKGNELLLYSYDIVLNRVFSMELDVIPKIFKFQVKLF